jgi:membrane protein DedA with SNARE-associated domain
MKVLMLAAFPETSTSALNWLTTYGYLVFFPLTVVEGPIVTVIGGFLVSLGYFNFVLIYLLAVAGDLTGDMIYYSIGRWGGKRIMARGHFLHIRADQLERIHKYFQEHAARALLFGKWTISVAAVILIAAGMARTSIRKFLWFNLIGTLPKSLVFLLIGYYFGRAYREIDRYFDYTAVAIFLIVVLAIAVYFFDKHFKQSTK